MVVAQIVLDEPTKDALASSGAPASPCLRRSAPLVVPGPELTMHEYTVDLVAGQVARHEVIEGMRPALLYGESYGAILACVGNDEYVAALARRGITDLDLVQIDPWPAGSFGYAAETDRRIARCITFLRETPDDNGYARPIEGLIVHVDLGRAEVIEVIDHGATPLPTTHGRYGTADHQPSRHLAPIEITQPDGPGFTVDGDLLTWHRWQVRIGFDPSEGVVLHQLAWDDGERLRSVAHRLSVSEMVVPYGDPGEVQGWKNAFDAGEWGLGRMTQPLTLGCDCLGDITYLDAVMADEQGDPWVVSNAICLHEEDAGILWKHVDLVSGTSEVRRHRRMVINHVATVGNYEYAFSWPAALRGRPGGARGSAHRHPLDPRRSSDGQDLPHAKLSLAQRGSPRRSTSTCSACGSTSTSTAPTTWSRRSEVVTDRDGAWTNSGATPSTPSRRRSTTRASAAATPSTAGQPRPGRSPTRLVRNGLGQPVGYKLVPMMSTPTLLAHPESSVGKRAGFAQHNLWVTRYDPTQRRAAGDFPNQHAGGAGLPEFIAADRALAGDGHGTAVVLWYTFGVTHVPRPEDWPVMPVEWSGFLLTPVGFFDQATRFRSSWPPPDHCTITARSTSDRPIEAPRR